MPRQNDNLNMTNSENYCFDKKNIVQRLMMEQSELEKYYRELRKYQDSIDAPINGIEFRKKIHNIMVSLMKIERFFLKNTLEIVGDKRIESDKPKIYAVTHIGRYDIETAIEAIKDDAYFVWGDPGKLYKSPEMLLLNAIGMIFVDTDNKEDRNISFRTMVKVLNQNGNVLIYPEGAWNITENEVVMKLYTGAVRAAILGNAEIIPVAIEHYGNNYYVNIGENIDCSNMKMEDARQYTDDLRDIMATLKWEIWEKYGSDTRENITDNYSEAFLENIMKESENGYTISEIDRTRFKDFGVTTPTEAFEHLANLKLNKNNIFLLKNMNPIERERQAKILQKRA